MKRTSISRREFAGAMAGLALPGRVFAAPDTRQATGVKVGEVTGRSAVVWMRVTATVGRNNDGIVRKGRPQPLPKDTRVETLEGACPGAPGRVRLRYSTREDLAGAKETRWVKVTDATDCSHQFHLTGLEPRTVYHYTAETADPVGKLHGMLRGQFRTAPRPEDPSEITFAMITCQKYEHVDHADGYHIYDSMAKLKPDFLVTAGDIVYYDSDDPRATSVDLARYHWQRMYSFPRHTQLLLNTPGYWEKDDHDTHFDDGWRTRVAPLMSPFTFEEGLRIFREQVPMGRWTYRTFRWGKDLQIWLVEGRDYRSPNDMADGPDKSIWGVTQKNWLKQTLLKSDARWKILVSPTPIVGPDRPNKNDNHSNRAFAHEGREFREWLQKNLPNNFFTLNGDRHWQYHSVHPDTKLNEFSVGCASDPHAGGTPGEDKRYHRFHRVAGGFLSVNVSRAGIRFRHHDVHGKVVYEYAKA